MNVGRKKLRVCYYCYYWASEASPTLMSTIEIEIYIYIYIYIKQKCVAPS